MPPAKRLSLIYVNPIEYHGPHLPLTTDLDISRGLWKRLEGELRARGTPLQILSVHEIHRGCDPARGPGSEYTSLADLKRLLLATCRKVEDEDPDLVLFLTFHGSPTHSAAIEAAVEHLESQGIHAYNPFNLILKKLLYFDPSWVTPLAPLIEDDAYRPHWVAEVPQDFHAGLFETSVLLALDPGKVLPLYKTVPDCPPREMAPVFKFLVAFLRFLRLKRAAHELAFGADALAWAKHATYYGYTGKPRFASAKLGEAFVEIIVKDYLQGLVPALDGRARSPRPVLQWTTVL